VAEEIPVVSICIRRETGSLHRSGRLTPYFAELLVADLRRLRPERIEVVVRSGDDARAFVRELGSCGVRIVFRRRAA
jgi:hypothetical protein